MGADLRRPRDRPDVLLAGRAECSGQVVSQVHARISKAFRVRSDRVRRMYVNTRKAMRFFRDAPRRSALRDLSPNGLAIPHDEGFLVQHAGSFSEIPAIVDDARAALVRYDQSGPPEGNNRKRFLLNVLDSRTLTVESAVVRFALRTDVLAAVATYLGVVPFLGTISVFHSDTVEGVPTSSQLHHCDGDDVTQVKIFIYCSDVDQRSGPLTILGAAKSDRVRRATGYHFRQRLTDTQVQDVVGVGSETAILGPAGTLVFVDTSRCFHFGSRVERDAPPRLVTMIQYQTPYSFMLPASAQDSLPFRRLSHEALSPVQRLVLGA
jgi:hypothetical protein